MSWSTLLAEVRKDHELRHGLFKQRSANAETRIAKFRPFVIPNSSFVICPTHLSQLKPCIMSQAMPFLQHHGDGLGGVKGRVPLAAALGVVGAGVFALVGKTEEIRRPLVQLDSRRAEPYMRRSSADPHNASTLLTHPIKHLVFWEAVPKKRLDDGTKARPLNQPFENIRRDAGDASVMWHHKAIRSQRHLGMCLNQFRPCAQIYIPRNEE